MIIYKYEPDDILGVTLHLLDGNNPADFDTLPCSDLAYHTESCLSLLTNTQRESDLGYSIFEEYPLLFAQNKNKLSKSIMIVEKEHVIGHISFLERPLVDRDLNEIGKVALVGNVSTSPDYRNKGIMTKLLEYASEKAKSSGLLGVFLWSDSPTIYEKTGFTEFGREVRYELNMGSLLSQSSSSFEVIQKPTRTILRNLLDLRQPVDHTIGRNLIEFETLLHIPDTYLVIKKHKKPKAFAIIGRGQDFPSTIHEFGYRSLQDFESLLGHIQKVTQLPSIFLLSPQKVNFSKKYVLSESLHSMCLAKVMDKKLEKIESHTFVWGLDSI